MALKIEGYSATKLKTELSKQVPASEDSISREIPYVFELELVDNKTQSFEPDWTGEPQDWYTYRTEEDDDFINEENQLVINIDNYEYVYTDSE